MDLDDLRIDELRLRRGEKWQQYGDEVIAAWVADMDFPPPEPIRRELLRMIEVSDLGYPVNPRPTGLPTVFSERMAERFQWQVDPGLVEVITDVVQGLYVGLEVYCERGEGVVIQTPIYPPFLHAVADTGRRGVFETLVQTERGYEIDFDRMRERAGQSRVLMFCNPHNPTGRVFSRSELEELAEIAIEHDWVVLSDEIHADLVFPGHTHIPFATLGPEVEARTVTLMSASKAFNVAGLRCAVAAFGSAELKRRFNSIPRHLRGGISGLGLAATRVAWEKCQDWLDEVLAYLQRNRDFVAEFAERRLPGVRQWKPEGTYLAWLDCRALGLEPGPAQHFLERARVALSDGRAFGEGGEGCVRLNFATSRKILSEILERIADVV